MKYNFFKYAIKKEFRRVFRFMAGGWLIWLLGGLARFVSMCFASSECVGNDILAPGRSNDFARGPN